MMLNRVTIVMLAVSCGLTVGSCSDAEKQDYAVQRARIKQRCLANAEVYNARIMEAYRRGSKACSGLEKSGYQNRRGCPRPAPTLTTCDYIR